MNEISEGEFFVFLGYLLEQSYKELLPFFLKILGRILAI
jgi:hypothetical protein